MDTRVESELNKFKKYLGYRGLKLTNGRKVVFQEVIKAHGHFAPEELVKQCRHNRQKVSRATIYRSLKELLEAGIIRETAFGEKHTHYEHIYDEKPHHHARCIRCGLILEFPDLKEDSVYLPLLKKKRFHVLGHEMHFYGFCDKCQIKGRD